MAVIRPYRRICRQFVDGSYAEGGRWMYLLHKRYATDPRHYVRAFLLLQEELLSLFAYVEPSDINLDTYSHRIQQLLMRACVEVEANLTAILLDNGYVCPDRDLSMKDYRLVEQSHRLSAYEVRVPGWHGERGHRRPFAPWSNSAALPWYVAYNKSKHSRHENFTKATLDSLVDAFCGLGVLLASQFRSEDYSPGSKSLSLGGADYYYDGDDGMEPGIGEFLRIRFPTDWPQQERYDFNWTELKMLDDPFVNFPYQR